MKRLFHGPTKEECFERFKGSAYAGDFVSEGRRFDEGGDGQVGGIVLAFHGEEFNVEVPAGKDDGDFVEERVDRLGIDGVVSAVHSWSGTRSAVSVAFRSRSRVS